MLRKRATTSNFKKIMALVLALVMAFGVTGLTPTSTAANEMMVTFASYDGADGDGLTLGDYLVAFAEGNFPFAYEANEGDSLVFSQYVTVASGGGLISDGTSTPPIDLPSVVDISPADLPPISTPTDILPDLPNNEDEPENGADELQNSVALVWYLDGVRRMDKGTATIKEGWSQATLAARPSNPDGYNQPIRMELAFAEVTQADMGVWTLRAYSYGEYVESPYALFLQAGESLPIGITPLADFSGTGWSFEWNTPPGTGGTLTVTNFGGTTAWRTGRGPGTFQISDVTDIEIIIDAPFSLGSSAFSGTSVTSVTIPAGVLSIGDWAFMNTPNLTNVTIEHGLSIIHELAFYNSALTSVVIPNSVQLIGERAFANNPDLTSVTLSEHSHLISIYNDTFRNTGLTSIVIPNNIRLIGANAFNGSPLESVTFGSGLESIGNSAFNSTALTSVIIPNGVTTLGSGAFSNIPTLSSVTIPVSVGNIGSHAFANNPALTSVTFATATPPTLGENGAIFFNSPNITIHVPFAGLTAYYNIPPSALSMPINIITTLSQNFNMNTNTTILPNTTVIIPAGLTLTVANGVTLANTGTIINNGTIANNGTVINSNTITGTGNITGTQPTTADFTGNGWGFIASSGTLAVTSNAGTTLWRTERGGNFQISDVQTVQIANTVTNIGSNAFADTSLTTVSIPNSVTAIGGQAFAWTSLTSLLLPNNIATIGVGMFNNTGITSIVIPASVTSMTSSVFNNMPMVSSITFLRTTPPTFTIPAAPIFGGTLHPNFTVNLPFGSWEAYYGVDRLRVVSFATVLEGNTTMSTGTIIPQNTTLTIPSGMALTIPNGVTLANEGIIRIYGTLQNNGAILNDGTIIGTVSGNPASTAALQVNGGALLTAPSQLTGAISNAFATDNYAVVTGNMTGVAEHITIVIPGGRTLIWDYATYEGDFAGSLINITGAGLFQMAGGVIENNNGPAILRGGGGLMVMNGGRITAAGGNAVGLGTGVGAMVIAGTVEQTAGGSAFNVPQNTSLLVDPAANVGTINAHSGGIAIRRGTAGTPIIYGSTAGLTVYGGAGVSAAWAYENGQHGIRYQTSTHAGFHEIFGVFVELRSISISGLNEVDGQGTHTFPAAVHGYGAQTPLTITVANAGNLPTGTLYINDGNFAVDAFTNSGNIASIAVGGEATFTIWPVTGLPIGTHTASFFLEDIGINISEVFMLSFTVAPPPIYLPTGTFEPGFFGMPQTWTIPRPTGGVSTGDIITFALAPGSTLPAGLTLSTAGNVTNAAGANSANAGIHTFSVIATNISTGAVSPPQEYAITINPRQLTWGPGGLVNVKTFDGTTNATVNRLPALGNLIGSDTAVAVPGTVNFANPNVGTGIEVIATGWTVEMTNGLASNYIFPAGQPTFANSVIIQATGTFTPPTPIETTFAPTLTLANLTLPTGFAWVSPATSLNAGTGQTFPATFTDPSGNFTTANGNITVNVAQATQTAPAAPFIDTLLADFVDLDHALAIGHINDWPIEFARSNTSTAPTADSAWQHNAAFDNLTPGTTYYFFARMRETANHYPSPASAPLQVTTPLLAGTFTPPTPIDTTFTPTLTLADLTLPAGFAWVTPTTALNAGNAQSFPATFTDPSGNFTTASGYVTVNVAQATATAITTTVNPVTRTAYEARAATDIAGIITLAQLPANVNVTITGGHTTTLPITWTTSVTHNSQGAAYTFTGTLTGNANIVNGGITASVTVTIDPTTPPLPTFDPIAILQGEAPTAAQLPTSGNVMVGSESVAYSVAWDAVDTSSLGNVTATGTASFPGLQAWLTLPSNFAVTRTLEVTDLTPRTMTFPNANESRVFGTTPFTITPTQTPAGAGGTLTFASNNTAVATVNETTGQITIVGVGSATITANITATTTHTSATASFDLTVTNASQNAPTGFILTHQTATGINDGIISNVSTQMEWRAESDMSWTAVTGADITGLAPGVYHVRLAKRPNFNASPYTVVEIQIFVAVAPTFTGGQTTMQLTEGYSATHTTAFAISGNPAPTVTINNNHGGRITWNAAQNRLDIAAGLSVGTYTVVLTANNGITPNATHTFTLTVVAQQGGDNNGGDTSGDTWTPTPTTTTRTVTVNGVSVNFSISQGVATLNLPTNTVNQLISAAQNNAALNNTIIFNLSNINGVTIFRTKAVITSHQPF